MKGTPSLLEGAPTEPHIGDRAPDERDRLVATLRTLVDRIETAPLYRLDALAWMTAAVDTLAWAVERALGREPSNWGSSYF